MALHIYNVISRQKERFETLEPGEVSLYVCGPTVYDDAHVGHAMSALVFDMIRRYLEYSGYTVKHVMNYTDVDDKIINRANDLNMGPVALAEQYIDEFAEHIRDLNILPATAYPRATQVIAEMIAFIQGLIDTGYAYPAEDGTVYFRVEKDDDYGKLSRRKLDDMQAGSRIEVDQRKEHPMDFALWKAAKPGEPQWASPWGPGRPGWHIECSTMVRELLGDQIDIHGGGNDLLFPHHENEMAQSESLTGQPMARYWVHNGMLQLSGEKMSKSIGNLVTINDFLVENDADVLRLLVLGSHYRSPLTFNDEVIEQSRKGLERLRAALRATPDGVEDIAATALLHDQIDAARQGFIDAMDDDFNTAAALASLYNLVRAINQGRDNGATLDDAQQTLRELAGVLGLTLATGSGDDDATLYIDLLVEVRDELRQQKQWTLSDLIRDRLAALGVIIEDSAAGSSWHRSV